MWICHIIAGLNAHSCELSCSVTLQHCSTAALSANTASPKYTPKVCQANLYQLDNNPSGGGRCSAACRPPACCRIMQNCLKLQVIHHGGTAAPPACNYCSADHTAAAAHRPPLSAIFAIAGKTAVAVLRAAVLQLSVFMLHTRTCSHSCARWLQTSGVTITSAAVPVELSMKVREFLTIFGESIYLDLLLNESSFIVLHL